MHSSIQLLSLDFDGTLVSRAGEPVLDMQCMELIRDLQDTGAIWAINTGRSVDLLESGLADFSFPIRPDFILTNKREPGTRSSTINETRFICAFAMPITTKARRSLNSRV